LQNSGNLKVSHDYIDIGLGQKGHARIGIIASLDQQSCGCRSTLFLGNILQIGYHYYRQIQKAYHHPPVDTTFQMLRNGCSDLQGPLSEIELLDGFGWRQQIASTFMEEGCSGNNQSWRTVHLMEDDAEEALVEAEGGAWLSAFLLVELLVELVLGAGVIVAL
jgi:hypothetical protein